jgi:DNA polymerase II large subunit
MMDAPLVVSVSLNPFEVDDEAWNVDVGWFYPLEFYEATERLADPKELANKLEVFEAKLGSDNVFEGVGFTHDTSDINVGPENTAYKMLASIPDKVKAQLSLAEKICAVDEADVALRVLNSHFIPDIIGNLGAFTKQQFRCQKCNKKFRRVPLSGVCSKKNCGGKILPTVYKGGIEKYLEVAESIISKYHLPRYLSDRLEIIRMNIESLFENDKIKQPRLSQYF